MESFLFRQEDTYTRIAKARLNFKKTPKERLNKNYVDSKLEALEKLWSQFLETHTELLRVCDVKEIKASAYMTKDIYGEAEEIYCDLRCILKASLDKYNDDMEQFSECNPGNGKGKKSSSSAKLPKIVIPKFSGDYNEWSTFRDLFLSLVHKTEMEPIQKFQYLKALLGGEAEQLVRHVSLTGTNYNRCWDMLEARYNNKRYLCNNILKRLFSQRNANTESAQLIRELLDTTSECMGALESLGVDVSSWDVIIVYVTALKLDLESRKQWELQSASSTDLPSWKSFQDFLTNRFRALEFVDSSSSFKTATLTKQQSKSFHVSESERPISCKLCKEPHRLTHCKDFVGKEVQDRRTFVEKHDLCFNCLGDKHRASQCRSLSTCRVCQRRHHTYLHSTNTDSGEQQTENKGSHTENASGETAAPVVCFASGGTGSSSSQVLLATALVRAQSQNGDTHVIRALLDQGSQASFITEATAQYLGLKRTPVRGVVSGLEGHTSVLSKSMVKIRLTSMHNKNINLIVNVYVLKSITTLLPSKKVVSAEWVVNIPLADPKYNIPNRIDILLGAAVYGQVVLEGVKKNPEGTLLAQNTTLGWILSGVVSNLAENQEANLVAMHTCFEDMQLKQFWELEADPNINKKLILTDEETHCEKFFAETIARDQDGRYIVRLPFKPEQPDLKTESSKRIAERRLRILLAKLSKANDMKDKYTQVIEEYSQLGHMEKIPEPEINCSKGAYLSHFAVIREDKDTSKVRIVFDASCKDEDGVSLNNMLMVGPTLQPELRHLLMRWRLHRICLAADIVKMYRQVKVAAPDADYQRILWKKDQSSQTKAEEFRLLRVTFGTASAPYLAVKALQQVAHDEGASYPLAAEKVFHDYYMDDLLTGCEDLETAMQIYREMTNLLLKGGFELQKWSSNCGEVMDRIAPPSRGAPHTTFAKTRSPARWSDDLRKAAGRKWMRRAEHRAQWRVLGEAYVQQWTNVG